MKKTVFEKLLWDNDYISFSKTRDVHLVCMFTADNMPTFSVTYIPRGSSAIDGIKPSNDTVNLANLRKDLLNLAEDELFVLGRLPECDYRIGLPELEAYYKKNGDKSNPELFYMRHATTISRIHCFIKKTEDGKFALFDCSTAGVCIMLN